MVGISGVERKIPKEPPRILAGVHRSVEPVDPVLRERHSPPPDVKYEGGDSVGHAVVLLVIPGLGRGGAGAQNPDLVRDLLVRPDLDARSNHARASGAESA